VSETDQHHHLRAEPGDLHQRQVDLAVEEQHEVHGYGDIPEQQPEQRPAYIAHGLDDQAVFFDDGSFQTETSRRAVNINALARTVFTG